MKKIFDKKIIYGVIIGGILFGSIGVLATNYLYKSSQVSYSNDKTDKVDVNEALNELYGKINEGNLDYKLISATTYTATMKCSVFVVGTAVAISNEKGRSAFISILKNDTTIKTTSINPKPNGINLDGYYAYNLIVVTQVDVEIGDVVKINFGGNGWQGRYEGYIFVPVE